MQLIQTNWTKRPGRTSVVNSGVSRLVSPEVERRSARFYHVSEDNASITCLVCGQTSYNPAHVRARFCPQCFVFHEDRELMLRLNEGREKAFTATDTSVWLRLAA